jgi:ankyrin repeat protein
MRYVDDIDTKRRTALHFAAISGNMRIIRHLLQAGASRSAHDFDGKTPLDLTNESEIKEVLKKPSCLKKVD